MQYSNITNNHFKNIEREQHLLKKYYLKYFETVVRTNMYVIQRIRKIII